MEERYQGFDEIVMRKHFKEFVDNSLINKYDSDVWNAISVIWETPCQLAGTLVQDLLELGKEARFNIRNFIFVE